MPPEPAGSPSPFSNVQAVARYAEGPPRIVPGFAGMQRMATLLLAERVPEEGRVLVVGAGGGLELKAFAEAHPGWTFDGVDPAAEMLHSPRKRWARSHRASNCIMATWMPHRLVRLTARPVS